MSERLAGPCLWCKKQTNVLRLSLTAGSIETTEFCCSMEHLQLAEDERLGGRGVLDDAMRGVSPR